MQSEYHTDGTLLMRASRKSQRGVNLIEIMVAMTIGLFLIAGASTLYVNTKRTSDVDDAVARLQETARYALSVIEADARMANYWGLQKNGSSIKRQAKELDQVITTSIANGGINGCGDIYTKNLTQYLEATNNQYTFNCTPFGGSGAEVTSSDTLTVRRANQTPSTTIDANRVQLNMSRSCGEIIEGSLGPGCATQATIYNLVVNGYYVDQQSSLGATIPSLRRKTLESGGFTDTEIIPGVEDMQIELNWDSSSDPTQIAQTTSVLQPGNASLSAATVNGAVQPNGRVLAVRVWLLIRAEQADGTYRDTNTYQYGDRRTANGTTATLNATAAAGKAYAPNDNFRRILVSRTIFVRNATGT